MSHRKALTPESDYRTDLESPLVFIPARRALTPSYPVPDAFRDRVLVDTIHDGEWLPPEFLTDARGQPIEAPAFRHHFERERDWGADLVASHLVDALGLDGHYRVTVARVLMDYGRFPGITHESADYLRRFAINFPFSGLLSYEQRRRLLEHYYDRISGEMDGTIRGRLIKIAVHTYDRHNATGTERPHVSLVTRALAYQTDSRLPVGVFDPMYPDVLAEFTADRILTDRISLTLEKTGIPVAHNYPYCLPEGSIEVRAQVWFYFAYLQQRFEAAHPDTVDDPSFQMLWAMLMDTNLRSTECEALRSYLHLYRRAPDGAEDRFRRARKAYDAVRAFQEADHRRVIEEYRLSQERPSSFAIEVRKDLVWNFDAADRPTTPRPEGALVVAQALARALLVYLTEDKPNRVTRGDAFERADPWYRGTRTPQGDGLTN